MAQFGKQGLQFSSKWESCNTVCAAFFEIVILSKCTPKLHIAMEYSWIHFATIVSRNKLDPGAASKSIKEFWKMKIRQMKMSSICQNIIECGHAQFNFKITLEKQVNMIKIWQNSLAPLQSILSSPWKFLELRSKKRPFELIAWKKALKCSNNQFWLNLEKNHPFPLWFYHLAIFKLRAQNWALRI